MINFRKKIWLWLIVTVIVLFTIIQFDLLSKAGVVSAKALEPFQAFFYKLGLIAKDLKHLPELRQENDFLKEEIADLSIDYVKLSSLKTENEYLRSELDYLQENDFLAELVNIIGRQSGNDKILIIDKGSDQGLEVGQPATLNQGLIVGKIIKVEPGRALVELLNSPTSQLAVTLAEVRQTSGMLVGEVGNNLIMDLIPQGQEVKADDLVITSGLEIFIPRGLLIGRVREVSDSVSEIFKQAKIESAVNYLFLNRLTIIKSF